MFLNNAHGSDDVLGRIERWGHFSPRRSNDQVKDFNQGKGPYAYSMQLPGKVTGKDFPNVNIKTFNAHDNTT